MNDTAPKKPNPSLQRKSAARLAAVQILYRMAMTDEAPAPAAQVAQLKKQLSGNRNEQKLRAGVPVEPDYAMLERLLTAMENEKRDIDAEIDGALSEGWSRERMSPLLVALLECALCELFYDKDLSSKIITDEYTRMARSFFADDEVRFVHGVLSKLAGRRDG